MRDTRVTFRYSLAVIFTAGLYALTSTLSGSLADFLSHLHHHNIGAEFNRIIHWAERGRYLLWPITHPTSISWFGVAITVAFALWETYSIFKITGDSRRRYKQRAGYASHGTSRFQESNEARHYFHQDNNGILLGQYQDKRPKDPLEYRPLPEKAFEDPKIASYSVHPFSSELNQNYILFGPPGSKKTTGFILPNLFHLAQQGLSMVVTDPKGELYQHTANYMRERGYNVVVLDYLWFKYGHRQNLIDYVYEESHYGELASMFMSATRNEGDKRDFWEGKAQELFTALIGFVHQAYKGRGTFTDVYEISQYITSDPAYVLNLFDQYNVKGSPMRLLRGILGGQNAENMLGSVQGTLSEKLQLFTYNNVMAQTSTTDYNLANVGKEKTVVYVWISDSQKTYAPIISVFWTVLFNALYEAARTTGGRLPVPVVCLIDEMANIGKIGDFDTKLTTMRSRRIFPMMVWHDYPQLKSKYGDNLADTILGACNTKILLSTGDMQTADLFSKMLGDTTIETQSRRGSQSIAAEMTNATNQFTGRRLLQSSEIQQLESIYSIVQQTSRPPVLLNKLQYMHWKYQICPEATLDQLPQYQLNDDAVTAFSETLAGARQGKRAQKPDSSSEADDTTETGISDEQNDAAEEETEELTSDVVTASASALYRDLMSHGR